MTDPSTPTPPSTPTQPPAPDFAQYAPAPIPPRRGLSTRTKILIAAGIALVIVLIVVAVVSAVVTYRTVHTPGGPAANSNSYAFNSKDYGYTVEFPGKPKEQSQVVNVQGNDVTAVTESWAVGNRAAVVTAADYPDGFIVDTDASLKGSIEGYAGNIPGAELSDETPRTFAGMKAIEGTITIPSGTLDVIIAFDGDRQYQLTDGNGTSAEKKAFFDSFKLTK